MEMWDARGAPKTTKERTTMTTNLSTFRQYSIMIFRAGWNSEKFLFTGKVGTHRATGLASAEYESEGKPGSRIWALEDNRIFDENDLCLTDSSSHSGFDNNCQ